MIKYFTEENLKNLKEELNLNTVTFDSKVDEVI